MLTASVNDGTYAAADIERVRTEDEYLLRFLKSRGLKDAPSYMDNAFKFRKEYNVNGQYRTPQCRVLINTPNSSTVHLHGHSVSKNILVIVHYL